MRWILQFVIATTKFVRVFFALQAIAGAVRIVIGALTLNATTALAGCGQIALGVALLAVNGGSSEQVLEVRGPDGQFVIRSERRRAWRDQRGWRKAVRFVWGGHTWRTSVRQRADDPFGRTIWWTDSQTQREANEAATQVQARLRQGEDLTLNGAP